MRIKAGCRVDLEPSLHGLSIENLVNTAQVENSYSKETRTKDTLDASFWVAKGPSVTLKNKVNANICTFVD